LWFKWKKSDRQSFEEQALEHLDLLYGTALRLTGRSADAEDLVHDTYLRALRFRHRFEPGTNLKAWMFKMMFNLFVNRYRRDRRGREIREGHEREDLSARLNPDDGLAPTLRPEEHFFERLFSDDVVRALDEVPPDFRMVVILADLDGFSYRQISEILGIPVGTVMSRLHRGRRLLRTALYEFALREGYIKPTSAPAGGAADEVAEEVADLDAYRLRRSGGRAGGRAGGSE
jgi:RNA polymerase sigma-70 factor (ECF subfamily)